MACLPICPKKILSLGTNPAPVPVYTFNVDDADNLNAPNNFANYENRIIWLNGLSIEVLKRDALLDGAGAIKLRVKWNDYEVDRDVRWCGNIKLSPSINGITGALDAPSEYALNLMPGRTIRLDHGLSPTRDRNPVTVNGEQVFADPTIFTCLPNSYFHMEPNSTVIVENGSEFRIQQNAKLEIHENSQFIVKSGSKLILEQGAELHVSNNALVKIESGAILEYDNGVIVLGGEDAVLEIEGTLDIANNATFTFDGGNSGSGYVVFSGPDFNLVAGNNTALFLTGLGISDLVLKIDNANVLIAGNPIGTVQAAATMAIRQALNGKGFFIFCLH